MWRSKLCFAVLAASTPAQQFQWMPDQAYGPRFPAPQHSLVAIPPVTADFTGDGRSDVVFAMAGGVLLYSNLGGARYAATPRLLPVTFPGGFHPLHAVDYDADGDIDLVASTGAQIELIANDGTGAFSLAGTVAVAGASYGASFALADVDGDGDTDFARGDAAAIHVVRTLGPQAWSVQLAQALPGTTALVPVTFADLDGDGDQDLATGAPVAGGYLLLANDGTGALTATLGPAPFPAAPLWIRAADFDDDGDLDLMAANPGRPAVMLLENLGGGSFADRTFALPPLPTAGLVRGLQVGDFDLDGDVDALALGVAVVCLRNDGGGRFFDASATRWGVPGLGLYDSHLGDFDDDGDLDLAIADAFGTQLTRARWIVNHTRQLYSAAAPRVGGTLTLDLYSGPGYAPPLLQAVCAGLAIPAAPLRLPGITGALDLDLPSAALLRLVANSPLGRSQVFVPLPADPALAGVALYAQPGYLPLAGLPVLPALGNPVGEVVLP